MSKSLIFFILISFLNSSLASTASSTSKISRFVSDFIVLVSKNNFVELDKIADFESKELPNITRFLNGNNFLPSQRQSLAKIVTSSTSIVIAPVYYENSNYRKFGAGYTVFFLKSGDISAVLSGKKRWLVDYAACDFFIKMAELILE
jgi:hypothetical protein